MHNRNYQSIEPPTQTSGRDSSKCRVKGSSSILFQTSVNMHDEMEHSLFTGKITYYILSSVLTIGILMLILIPLGSTFLYIDYKQQLAQRKSNKSDLCRSKCLYGAECIVDEYTNQPFCRCSMTCDDEYRPVCGSDGVTYMNLCHLKYESCNKQQRISALANSTCDASLCDNVTCQRNQKCEINAKGRAQCVCNAQKDCSNQPAEPVCASNGRLYSSLCELKKYACFYNVDIVTVQLETCLKQNADDGTNLAKFDATLRQFDLVDLSKEGNICGDQVCPPYAKCVNETANDSIIRKTSCQCPANCSQEDHVPVCGTNNRNYANECEMRRDACLHHKTELQVLHHGQCGQCNKQCMYYSRCQLNEQNIPECVCPQVCIRVDRPVCGDNGVTYENECELQVASCHLQRQIAVKFNASCDLCHNIVCSYGATCVDGQCICVDNCQNSVDEPLCANDGNTYRNECEMNRVACNSKMELIALFYGKCEQSSDSYADDQIGPNHKSGTEVMDGNINTQIQAKCQHMMNEACNQPNPTDPNRVFVCENKIFASKCEMYDHSCRESIQGSKCLHHCECNKHGLDTTSLLMCNSTTKQCVCKEGLSGLACDQCAINFWDYLRVQEEPNLYGCKHCNCNPMGSLSEDCNKFNGKCKCKPGVKGLKCDRCPPSTHLTVKGCVHNLLHSKSVNSCHPNKCHHGAVCKENGKYSSCVCHYRCKSTPNSSTKICASDGSIHKSMCHFREYMCQLQKKLHILKRCLD